MVMGPTHSMSGAAAGLAIATVLPPEYGGPTSVGEAFVFAGITAGAALLPDLDMPGSTLARSFGPVSDIVARVVENSAQAFYNLTKTGKDDDIGNGHRTATHTIWFAIAVAVGCGALVQTFGKNAAVGLLFLLLGFALRGLFPNWSKKQGWVAITAISAATAVAVWATLPGSASGIALGASVFAGIIVHDLGDAITKQGTPFLGGLVAINGRRWWDFALPGPMRLRAGGMADGVLLTGFSAAAIALAANLVTSGL